MKDSSGSSAANLALKPYFSKLSVWALAVGTSIGWGSLVVTNSEYLSNGGPVGSALGLLVGALIMLIMARNYAHMIETCPDAGGIYTYVKSIFGYDRAFLVSWFLSLIYMAILWANATSVPLFVRYFVGETFQFGYLYTLFGYRIYLGEILLTLAVFLFFGYICATWKKLTARLIVITVLVFCAGITLCFAAAMLSGNRVRVFDPAFLPDTGKVRQVIRIAFVTPWAFIGFESISHSAEEYRFRTGNILRILRLAVIVTTLLYVMILLMSVTAYPAAYGSWTEYIRDLDHLTGMEGLPAFYAAYTCMGDFGVAVLMLSLLGLIISSLIGNLISLSRLFYAVARDRILPEKFAALSRDGIPYRSVVLVLLLSLPIPFLGRTAIGWIVDVTTIGAVLIYGFVSAAVLYSARRGKNRRLTVTGALGLGIMVVFGVYILMQSILESGGVSRESQLILIVWSLLGLLYFRLVMVRDHGRRFGKNLAVWIVLVAFIFILSMIWILEEGSLTVNANLLDMRNHYAPGAAVASISEDAGLLQYRDNMTRIIVGMGAGVLGVFVVSLLAMFSNWRYLRRCEEETSRELGTVKTIAYRDPLTGVKSKHAFLETEAETDKAIDLGDVEDFSVLVCDVNGLKQINDTLGHQAGDAYIREAARLICETFKHSPVYRTGGDEFVVLINGQDYPQRHALLDGFNRLVESNIGTERVVISAGLADFVFTEDHSFLHVFERADRLMYDRKQQLKSLGAATRD